MSGVIGWFARNGVAANLLMVFIVVWGVLAMTGMPIEVFPSLATQSITVTVPYLGAAPEEVEQGVCLRVEEAVQDLEGVGIRSAQRRRRESPPWSSNWKAAPTPATCWTRSSRGSTRSRRSPKRPRSRSSRRRLSVAA